MKSLLLNAAPRVLGRRAGAKALRAGGRIPAVIYGRQSPPQNLEVNAKEMEDLIHHSVSETLLVDLAIKDYARPKRLALVQEVQHYPCLLYTSPSPRDGLLSRMPSSAWKKKERTGRDGL